MSLTATSQPTPNPHTGRGPVPGTEIRDAASGPLAPPPSREPLAVPVLEPKWDASIDLATD